MAATGRRDTALPKRSYLYAFALLLRLGEELVGERGGLLACQLVGVSKRCGLWGHLRYVLALELELIVGR